MQSLPAFLAALVAFLLISALRRTLHRRRVNPSLKHLSDELAAPQRLLFLYLAVRAAELFWTAGAYPQAAKALDTLSRFFGIVGILRLGDALVFAFIHWRGMRGAPRILRTLAAWAISFLVAAVLLRHQYRFDLSSLFATSALLSVVLGFALQETLGNLFAGLTLNAEQPFEPGEWVTFGKYTGLVLDVGWRSTRLMTLDEDEILVPNGLISREVVVNHMRPQFTDVIELSISIDLDVSPARAKAALRDAVSSCPLVLKTPAPVVQVASFTDHGVKYRVQFHTEGFHVERRALDQVQEAIWYALRRAAIDMPYPQTTIGFRERPVEAEERRRREHMAEAQDLLGRIDFLQALSPQARTVLAQRARLVEYGPGQAIVRQGEAGDTLYLVARGEVSVRVRLDEGEREVARLGRGALFGEMSVLTGEPRTATVLAVGEAALLALDRDAFERILSAEPELMEKLAETIARRRTALEAVRAEQEASAMEKETVSLLARLREIFGLQKRATGS